MNWKMLKIASFT